MTLPRSKAQTQKFPENHTTKRRISSKPKFHVFIRGGRGHGDNRMPHTSAVSTEFTNMPRGRLRPAPAAWAQGRPGPRRPHNLPRGDRPIHGGHGERVSTAQQHTTSTPACCRTPSQSCRPSLVPSPACCTSRASKAVLAAKLSQNPTPTADRLVPSAPLPNPPSSFHPSLASPGGKAPGRPPRHPSQKPRATKPFSLTPSLSRSAQNEPSRWVGRWRRSHKGVGDGRMMSGRSGGRDAEGEWEVRPGGMLVQRRDGEAPGPVIRIRVSHGANFREVVVPAQATFGTLRIPVRLLIPPPFCSSVAYSHWWRGREGIGFWILTGQLTIYLFYLSQHDSSVRSPSYWF